MRPCRLLSAPTTAPRDLQASAFHSGLQRELSGELWALREELLHTSLGIATGDFLPFWETHAPVPGK